MDYVTRGLAAEYSSKGIRVNGISPSLGDTALIGEFLGSAPTAEMKKFRSSEAPLNRLCTPLDIAKAALYFASPYFNDFQTYVSHTHNI